MSTVGEPGPTGVAPDGRPQVPGPRQPVLGENDGPQNGAKSAEGPGNVAAKYEPPPALDPFDGQPSGAAPEVPGGRAAGNGAGHEPGVISADNPFGEPSQPGAHPEPNGHREPGTTAADSDQSRARAQAPVTEDEDADDARTEEEGEEETPAKTKKELARAARMKRIVERLSDPDRKGVLTAAERKFLSADQMVRDFVTNNIKSILKVTSGVIGAGGVITGGVIFGPKLWAAGGTVAASPAAPWVALGVGAAAVAAPAAYFGEKGIAKGFYKLANAWNNFRLDIARGRQVPELENSLKAIHDALSNGGSAITPENVQDTMMACNSDTIAYLTKKIQYNDLRAETWFYIAGAVDSMRGGKGRRERWTKFLDRKEEIKGMKQELRQMRAGLKARPSGIA